MPDIPPLELSQPTEAFRPSCGHARLAGDVLVYVPEIRQTLRDADGGLQTLTQPAHTLCAPCAIERYKIKIRYQDHSPSPGKG